MIGPRHDRDAARIEWFTVAVFFAVLCAGLWLAVRLSESEFWRLMP